MSGWLAVVAEAAARPLVFLLTTAVVLGWLLPRAWVLFEGLLWWAVLGRGTVGRRLTHLARQDFSLSVREWESDAGLTRPAATVIAIGGRLRELPGLVRLLTTLRRRQAADLYRRVTKRLAEAWREGLPNGILLDYLKILKHLPCDDEDGHLRGRIVAANVTYLLGDLRAGRRLARRNLARAQRQDGPDGPAVLTWLASYAHTNARLFQGDFEGAAEELSQRWHRDYRSRSEGWRQAVLAPAEAMLNPVASVPRHMLLAAAFAGGPLLKHGLPMSPDRTLDAAEIERGWASAWYEAGVALSEQLEAQDKGISLHFTHAYMALYLLIMR